MILENDAHVLNAELNLLSADGKIQFEKDKLAVKMYHLNTVNPNTVFFHDLKEKLDYLVENDYYDKTELDKYSLKDIKTVFKRSYAKKFRFLTFLGAYKFYNQYALKTKDAQRWLERYEDRVSMVSLVLADGDVNRALELVDEIISGRFQPATPTFLNAGKKQRGELVSCFLMRVEDNMESIGRAINSSLQLSKRGGGVALCLTNLREMGAPIKQIENQSTGVIPVMKILEDSFSYANQLGARQGAGAVYLHAHHPDILKFLDTKRENADEKIRIKTLSLGVVIPDVTFELAKNNDDMYLFSPLDVRNVYGKSLTDLSVTDLYQEMVDDPRIKKTKIKARSLFTAIAEVQFESGYPYIMFEDAVNRANPLEGRINMSNLCTEILQTNSESTYNEDLSYSHIGKDISCNLGSLNIALALEGKNLANTINVAVRALTQVSIESNINSVPSIQHGNQSTHAIGLGQMNLHGFLAKEHIEYGSDESVEFVHAYFSTVAYHSISTSCNIAKERHSVFDGFETSKYKSGVFFEKYMNNSYAPKSERIISLCQKYNLVVPNRDDWFELKTDVMMHGMYNAYLQAIPPTGSISYINNSTSSIHPVAAKIEIRKEGKTGRVYYPQPHMTDENISFYKDAYEIGYEKIIDVYAAAGEHTDQGLSLTLFFKDTATTRDINKAQIYAKRKGIKTLYYIRVRQKSLEGTEVEGCVSCSL